MDSFGTSPADGLLEEQDAVRALNQLLTLEQEQLIAADVEAVAGTTEEKSKAAVQMAELASHRHKSLAKAGFEANETGMQQWLQSPAASPSIIQSWQELIELAETGKEINRVNGTLINKQIVRNQTVLNILQHGTAQGNNVYGPDGQASSKTTSRHIVTG